jgi:anti-sigma28 factor (negative regulator of flagellin synthesis)
MQMPSPIGPSQVHGPHGVNAPHAPFRNQGAKPETKTQATSDRVTISPAAEAAIQAAEAGDVRQDLVNRIRTEIAAGTYETPSKLEAALDRMLDELA